MAQHPSQAKWITVRITGKELLKRVQSDLEARNGVRMSYGQIVTWLSKRYLDEVKR